MTRWLSYRLAWCFRYVSFFWQAFQAVKVQKLKDGVELSTACLQAESWQNYMNEVVQLTTMQSVVLDYVTDRNASYWTKNIMYILDNFFGLKEMTITGSATTDLSVLWTKIMVAVTLCHGKPTEWNIPSRLQNHFHA